MLRVLTSALETDIPTMLMLTPFVVILEPFAAILQPVVPTLVPVCPVLNPVKFSAEPVNDTLFDFIEKAVPLTSDRAFPLVTVTVSPT